MIHTIDLKFLTVEDAIAAFVVPTENGAMLIECGPHSTLEQLLAGLTKLGLEPKDIHTLLLTHIHFDHAGAAWWFAQQGTKVYVHPRGHKHLLSPERLYESARMIYQDDMDRLWGKMEPIASDRLIAVADRETLVFDGQQVVAHHTPGHAVHHIAWAIDDVLFTGDVAGVKIGGGPVVPPCPPPDIHLGDWQRSIERMREINPSRFYLTHYGPIDNCEAHLTELEACITSYAEWIKPHAIAKAAPAAITDDFVEFVENSLREQGANDAIVAAYRAANPPWMSVIGLLRYWRKYGLEDPTTSSGSSA